MGNRFVGGMNTLHKDSELAADARGRYRRAFPLPSKLMVRLHGLKQAASIHDDR